MSKVVYIIMDRQKRKMIILYWLWRRRQCTKRMPRRFWVRPLFQHEQRLKQGDFHNLIQEMRLNDSEKFINYTRMSMEAFDQLLSIVGPHLQKVDIRRPIIPTAARLALTIRYLASGNSMVSLSYSYRIGLSTVSQIISETVEVIWEQLHSRELPVPTTKKWLEIAKGFKQKWQFPNCIGAIDGKHIRIQAPPNAGSEFYNYKGFHSIILLGVVNYNYKFILVDIGAQGRQSDSGVFAHSAMGQAFEQNALNVPKFAPISANTPPLPFCMVGDEAFPLTEYMLRPFPSKNLDLAKRAFNYRLSRARRISENAFGILVAKWRIFECPIQAKLKTIDNIVKATVCLHNFIIEIDRTNYITLGLVDAEAKDGMVTLGSWRQNVNTLTNIKRCGRNNYNLFLSNCRNRFMQYFVGEGSVEWQWDKL